MSFHFKQFSITEQTEGLKVNTDGCLLGALSEFDHPIKCLDIGTGTGVIALMLAQKYPNAKITAVELNEVACAQAQQNIAASPFNRQIELVHADILNFSDNNPYDLIVCNPPYFAKHLQGPDATKNMALHNDALPQKRLIEKTSDLLNEKGLFMVIYPPKEMLSFENIAKTNNLHIVKKFIIENKAGKHYRTIAGFSRTPKEAFTETIILMDDKGKRTKQFSEIMEDFYL